MDSMVWKETLDKIGELDSKTVILSGGEPSLHPNLEDIINYAFSKKIAVVLKTNGSLKIDYLFPTLSKGKLLIDISIDSANRQKQDYIRGIGTYNNIIELCKKAYDLREPLLNQVSVLVTKNNYKELNEIIEFAKQYNFRNISFSFPKEDISLLKDLGKSNIRKTLINILRYSNENKTINISCDILSGLFSENSYPFLSNSCSIKDIIRINIDGKTMTYCPYVRRSKITNWDFNQLTSKLREDLTKRLSSCQYCNWIKYCKGQCLVRSNEEIDFFCDIIKDFLTQRKARINEDN